MATKFNENSNLTPKSSLLQQQQPQPQQNFYFIDRPNSHTNSKATADPRNEITERDSRQYFEVDVGEVDTTTVPVTSSSSWISNLFQSKQHQLGYEPISNANQPVSLPRKMPVKVEPKVFFANERTFLAWLHMSVTLATISLAIVAFAEANEFSQIYGLLLMPVAIAFCVYSLLMYMKRAGMIRRKESGTYEDKIGPIVLAAILAISIIVNFVVKLYDYAT